MIHGINWHDLEFERVPVVFHSPAGVAQTRWERVGMPLIPQSVISGVFYLYASRSDAEAGRNPGGTGFIVRYDGTFNHMVSGHHFYGVTNWHVACKKGFSVIRLNKKDGGTDPIELGPEDWHFLPGKHDVAVAPLSLDDEIHDVSSISTRQFMERPIEHAMHRHEIGVGDDVFMIGLFIDHNGLATNVPSARFGNISMLPSPKAIIEQPTGYEGQSYVVDMHSRTGFSGSPVYVYRTFGNDLTSVWGDRFEEIEINNPQTDENFRTITARNGRIRTHNLFRLLGIHYAQFPERWPWSEQEETAEASRDLAAKTGYVEGMSGMTCVIPAWDIVEVLDMPALKDLRHPGVVAAKKAQASKPKAEAADPLSTDANPNHLKDFTRLVDVAARKQPQGDQT
jgi:hypothetical protein